MQERVLLADDNDQSRQELARALEGWGYQVILALNSGEMWSVLQSSEAPNIVLLDSKLANTECREACRGIRDLRGDKGLIIVFSSDETKSDHLDALEAGADAVIYRPVHIRELRMRLAVGMRGRRMAVSEPPLVNLPRPLRSQGHDASDRDMAGRIVARKYQVNTMIGRGGMGTVWKGTHLSLGMSVAIKFIKPEYAAHELARARFEFEARSAARLKTKYAVKIYDYGVTEGMPYLVMEYLEGVSLYQHIAASGPLSFTETLAIIAQAAHALDQLHSFGMIHRDVKPDNLLLVTDPDVSNSKRPYIAKLIDFGVAKMVAAQKDEPDPLTNSFRTQNGIVVGTPNYMPPEQLLGTAEAGVASDVWALACCAFAAMTGRVAFEGSSLMNVVHSVCEEPLPVPSEYNPDVPVEFDQWFARACSPDPAVRFGSARELARFLADAHADYTDACLDMSPSLNSFVSHRPPKAPSDQVKAEQAVTPVTTPCTMPALRRPFDFEPPRINYR